MLNIEVYPTDLYGLYSWNEAVKAVKLLGNGWRLPTKDELTQMYLNQKEICGFVANRYWSSSEDGLYYAWNQHFVNGYQHSKFKYDHCPVRPVRDLKPIKEHIDKVVSEKPSTWKEEAEEHEKNHKLYDKLADVELRLECCRDASNGKDLLITALEKRIAELEYQAFQYAMKNERSPKAYVEKCDDGSFNVCFGVFQRKYVPIKTKEKNESRRNL